MPTDIEVTLRLRPNANIIQTRDEAEAWIKDFLNPYSGGIDKDGWPFGGTLFSQDFARMVTDIAEVRHVVKVQLFDMSASGPRNPPGWEEGDGLSELILTEHDLFTVRRIRVQTEGTE